MSRDNDQNKKNLLLSKGHVRLAKKRCVYEYRKAAPKSLSKFHSRKGIISLSYHLSLLFTNDVHHYCVFGQANLYQLFELWKMPGQIWTIFLVQKCFQLLGCKTQNFQGSWQQRVLTGPKSYNGRKFMRLKIQLVIAEENFNRKENLCRVLIPTKSKDTDKQLKLAPKIDDVVDRAKKVCVTLLWYNVDKPGSAFAQIRLFARKNADEKFQHIVYVNYELEELLYLLDVMNSVRDKAFSNQPSCNRL